jgi:mono/diheme cytochrome c family protein
MPGLATAARRSARPSRIGALTLAAVLAGGGAFAQDDSAVRRGEYVAHAAGCIGCHTDTAPGSAKFGGGRPLGTPFGTFYGPNITPHPQAGIGRWSVDDLRRAMRRGERPDGAHYYPAFPYPAYARITDGDLGDLWAYLRSLPPSDRPNRAHHLGFPYRWRALLGVWKRLYFAPTPFVPDPKAGPAASRGAYLVEVLGHCGECHTPRNALGALRDDRHLAGARLPQGRAPNLTPTRLSKLTDAALAELLRTGTGPQGELADSMAEVVDNSTSRLTAADLGAMIAYLRSLPALPEQRQRDRERPGAAKRSATEPKPPSR